jgi:hypothetical protein
VAATTLLGLDEEPGELTGVGPITAPLARRIAADGTWRRLLTDPRTGRLDEVSADTYAPPQDMVDHVVTRDGTCRGIGCRIPATACDLDHEVPWPAEPTAITNLHALHQRHHDVKTHTDTTVVTQPDGTTVWTLPSGRTYRVPPHQLLQHPDLDPEPPGPHSADSSKPNDKPEHDASTPNATPATSADATAQPRTTSHRSERTHGADVRLPAGSRRLSDFSAGRTLSAGLA